tara:strand:- start:881 stop:1090 length:210 start_codon:yes stop_codon:yes gene_type:complete
MKNSFVTVRDKMVSKYIQKDNNDEIEKKSTNINVLLNRVKLDQKKESRKKLLFSAAASAGVVLFGVLIF